MEWLEVKVAVTHEAVEAVADLLTEAGSKGVVIDDPCLINELRNSGSWQLCDIPEQENTEVVTVSAYYTTDKTLNERLNAIEIELEKVEKRIGSFQFGHTKFRKVTDHDWANEWKKYFHVTHVGKSLVIKPSWKKYIKQSGEKIICIDPGMAFGTGTHYTTNMCMARLEKILPEHATVFDVGTGSGILAIAAALLGAEVVKAVDIDPVAVRVAKENVNANGLASKIQVIEGDLLNGTEGQADVIIANIIADIIIKLLHDIPDKLKDNGVFLASGIIEECLEDVKEEAERQGLYVNAVDHRGGWVVMQMSKVK